MVEDAMIAAAIHNRHVLEVEQVTETEKSLSIDLRTPKSFAALNAGITAFIFVAALLVFLVVQYFGLMENMLVRVLVIVAGLGVLLALVTMIVMLWDFYTCPRALIVFDRQSGMMTVRLGNQEETKKLPLSEIRAIVFVHVQCDPPSAQLLLERTDGVIVSLELETRFAPTSVKSSDIEEYKQIAQRIHRFLDLPTPVRSVSQNDVWRGQSKLAFDTPASEAGTC
ncbi:hypothetical protein RoseRS_1400 [Roseiflexus sp. RS-1]|nr:hypothetical protein RoseRS_1400 [Roseiflexus sp. RS-1]